jgi:multidrug transporter EmrE-like cation transporter
MEQLGPVGAAALLTVVESISDTAAKLGDGDKRFFDGYNTAVLYGGYNATAYVLSKVLKNNSIAITNAYWNAMTTTTHTLIGSLVFNEVITRDEYIGIALITLGIFWMRRK